MFAVITCLQKHDPRLVAWAAAICIVAVCASLSAYRRAVATHGTHRLIWIVIVALLLGSGVWATHFMAMLAYQPELQASFGLDLTALSLVAAIGGIGLGAGLAATDQKPWSRPIGGAVCGLSIALMHFIGVAAMRLPAQMSWNAGMVATAIAIAVIAASAAFTMAENLRRPRRWFAAALLLVIAICGLHFTAMAAVTLTPGLAPRGTELYGANQLAIAVGAFAFLLFSAGGGLVVIDRFSSLTTFSSLRTVLDGAPSALACYDRDNRLTFWNESYAALLRLSDITARRGLDFQEVIAKARTRGLAEGAAQATLVATLHKDGQPLDSFIAPDGRWMQQGVSATADGGFVIILTDITEHLELIRRQDEARRQAEAASEAKTAFLANMSHEIRTPLNGILGMVQVMQRDAVDSVQRRRLDVVGDAGQSLLAVLNNVLDLSKIEAGKLELDVQPFDLEETVRQAAATFEPVATHKGVELLTLVTPEARGVWDGDGPKLVQVLSNLLSNAIKFTAAGQVTLRVGAGPGGVAFEIQDSGVGIAHDKLDTIFDSFTQADASTTRQFGGTGLGLSICRQYVRLMGGEVAATSREGAGSTFSFILPLERSASALSAA